MSKFILELQWRNMLHDLTPGIEDFISKKSKSAYIGFDPTSDSFTHWKFGANNVTCTFSKTWA